MSGPRWITLAKYADSVGLTPDAIRSRVRRGVWQDGKHTKKLLGKRWVNVEEADKWADEFDQQGAA